MKDINKTEKMEYLNTKIYITKGDHDLKTGEFYDVVNGKILLRNSSFIDMIPYNTTFKSDFDLKFYFMDYEKRKKIGEFLGVEPLGWSQEGIEYIDINFLVKILKDFIHEPTKSNEIILQQIFNKL